MAERSTDDRHDNDEVEHVHMPSPSIWPLTLAFGVSMVGLGFLTNWVFIVFGAVFCVWAFWGWAQEMRHEPE
jgi:cytochrome c oxidase subunit 1